MMKYFDSWVPTCLMFGSLGFIVITAFIWNPIGVVIGFIILIGTVLSNLFAPDSNKQPLLDSDKQNLRDVV